MKWRDLLYFSKGERRALTLLLSLIAIAWLVIICTDPVASPTVSQEIRGESNPLSEKDVPDSSRSHQEKNPGKKIQVKKQVSPERKKTDALFKRYPKTEKFAAGTIVELNSADTTILKKVPGIGSAFARRIVKYRDVLGGFYSVGQLAEVYGIDEERYNAMRSWFSTDTSRIARLEINRLSAKELSRHPYIDYKQASIIERLVRQKGQVSGWEELSLLEEFSEFDRSRLAAYLSFQ